MNKNIKFWHRVQLPDGSYTPGIVRYGPDGGDWPTTRFGLPTDLTGKSVLDIGAWDGFFSFECEKRGAKEVIASNPLPPKGPSLDGFRYNHAALKSNVQHYELDIETFEAGPPILPFDLVLFYGVLYHLQNPLGAMENVAKLTAPGGTCLLETSTTALKIDRPMLEYSPRLLGDPMNFFYPNKAWIETAAKEYGFTSAKLIFELQDRVTYELKKA
jgi:tRNA (mo5U34)-methyltransferase